jgi:predicted RNA binding protein YcfA (HicA-like mRNA interferase family)
MKRMELIKKLTDNGWWFHRAGGNHDIYTNEKRNEPIGHHREIGEKLAQKILKRNGLK